MDIVTTIDRAGALGLQLTVTDGRLNVTGSKTAEAAALVRQLSTMKAAVIAHLTAPTPQPAPETLVKHSIGDDLGNLPPMRMVSKRPALPRDMWLGGLTPAENDAGTEQQQPRLHRRFAEYVGQVVSDDDMYELYYMAHRASVALKSEPLGATLPCRHRVLSCRLMT